MGCGPSWCASRFTRESFVRSVQQVEDDDALSSYHRFTVNKMILKYPIRAKTRTTNDMMKRRAKEGKEL